MKKLLILLMSSAMLVGVISGLVCMASSGDSPSEPEVVIPINTLKIGDYFTLGKYGDEPIVWRYVADDENGKLIVSDKSLFGKVFGKNNFWEESFIRKWLNSTVLDGEIEWDLEGISDYIDVEAYSKEKGFLHESNFSYTERSVMRTVTQWVMLPNDYLSLATNGVSEAYNAIKMIVPGNPRDGGGEWGYNISEFPKVYFGAAYEVTDTIFLLDEMQVYRIWENTGSCGTPNSGTGYYLRTPSKNGVTVIQGLNYAERSASDYPHSIRPAFYLDTDNAVILSGSGTENDTYVLNGKTDDNSGDNNAENNNANGKKKDGIKVFLNGSELSFDQSPIIENDRTLVPFRIIFEALGSEVSWDEATQTAMGKLNETTIQLTIGSETAYVNIQTISLDVPPRIINNRTLVPLRFIAENFGFKVDWDEVEQRIDIIV